MPVIIDGQTYYRTAEVFRMIGISRNTLYRWLQKGILLGVERRDSRGWRLFTEDDVGKIRAKTNKVEVVYTSLGGRNDTN